MRAVELGSFSAVARERDTAASQVSRAVDRLEAVLRVKLLRRSTHGLSLTLFRDPTWYPVHAVMLPDRDRLPRIRAVVDALAEALGSSSGQVKATAP